MPLHKQSWGAGKRNARWAYGTTALPRRFIGSLGCFVGAGGGGGIASRDPTWTRGVRGFCG